MTWNPRSNHSGDRWHLIEQILEAVEDCEQTGAPCVDPPGCDAEGVADHLRCTMVRQVQIERAKGLLAERHRITVDEALDLIRSHGRRNGAPLGEVARALVEE